MSLKKRFFILNISAVLITLVVTALAAVLFTAVYTFIGANSKDTGDFKRIFDVKTGFNDIKSELVNSHFNDYMTKDYQDYLTMRLRALDANVSVIRQNKVIFSTNNLDMVEVEKCLSYTSNSNDYKTIELSGDTNLIDRVDINSGGVVTTFILFAPMKLNMHLYEALIIFTIIIFILVFIGLNLWITTYFSRNVIEPVSKLNRDAAKISDGELDFEIAADGEGEINELFQSFEKMRITLKNSVLMQEKYDENRKFLVSSISHDLKTPVTSIKGYIEGILDGVAKTPEKINEYLSTALSKSVLVNSMIDDLLLYSKLDLRQIPYNFEKISIQKYFEYCVGDFQYEFEKANIRLELKNELKDEVYVLIDQERLKRVFQNILENAKKYSGREEGQVSVVLRETRTSAIVEIRDNGVGIPQDKIPYIFDRFYRGDQSRNNTEGSGLGLAIAKQIIEGHEGKIWAVSNKGEGTAIIISLKRC